MSTQSARAPWRLGDPNSRMSVALLLFAVAVLSYLSALLATALRVPPRMVSPLWTGNALVVAVLLVVPKRLWAALITVALAVMFVSGLLLRAPFPALYWLVAGDGVAILIVAFGVNNAFRQIPRLNSVAAFVRYSFFAVGLAPLVSAFVGAAGGRNLHYYWLFWRVWFFSEVLAFLILTPAILSFFDEFHSLAEKTRTYFVELSGLFMMTSLLAYFLFIVSGPSTLPALFYSLVPVLLWSALRFGLMGTATSMILISILSIWGAAHGVGPFTGLAALGNVLELQLFLVFAATPFMFLAVMVQERKQTEKALRQSEEKFSKAFRESPMAVTLTSTTDHRYIDVNESFERLTGWQRDEIIGRTPFDVSIWVDPRQRIELVRRLQAEGSVRDLEVQYRRKDGTKGVGLGSAELLEIENEPCILSVIADITERKRAEEALAAANERLRLAMESGKSVGWEWDVPSGRAIRFGDLQSVYGVPTGTQSGSSQEFYQWVHPDDRQRVSEAVTEARRDQKPYSAEFRIVRTDGTVRWLDAKGEFLYAQDGAPQRMLGMAMDITERKRAEERLREYEKAVEGADEMIAVVDREYRYIIANRAFLEHRNMTRDQVVGRKVSEILNPGAFEEIKDKLDECFQGKAVRFEMQYTYPDLGRKDLLLSYFPIEGPNGIDAAACILQDFTERKQAERRLEETRQDLLEAQRVAQLGSWQWDVKMGAIAWSEELYRIHGLDPTLQPPSFAELPNLFTSESWNRLSAAMKESLTTGSIPEIDLEVVRPDGSRRWVATRGEALRDEGTGQVIMTRGTVQDITQRKRMENELQESQNRLQAVVSSAMDAIIAVDEEQRIVLFNSAAEQMFGCSGSDAIGNSMDRFLPTRFRTAHGTHVRRFAESGVSNRSIGTVLWGLRANGEEFPIEASVSQIRSDGKRLFTVIIRDVSARLKAQEALRESEERYRHLVESSNDWVWEVNENLVYTYVSPWCRENLGYEPEELIGKTPFDLMPPEEARRVVAEFNAIVAQRKAFRGLENVNLHKDGHEVVLETNGMPVIDKQGKFRGYRGMDRDVTGRRQAEKALRDSEESFRRVVEHIGDALVVDDVEGRVTFANDQFLNLFGFQSAEVSNLKLEDYVADDYRAQFRDRHDRRMRGEEVPSHFEYGGSRLDGRRMWLEVDVVAIKNQAGNVIGSQSAIRDITERKRAESALHESEERFRLVANTAPVMIWMSGPDKLCNYFNQPWLEFTGRSLEAELRNGWAEGVHPEDLNGCLDIYTRSFDLRESFKMQYRLRRNDGEYRWVLDIGVPRFNPDGSFAGYIGSCIDVTDRKLAEEALADMGRRLIEAHEEERTWIARELHDDINQRIALLAIELDQLKQEMPESAPAAHKHMRQLRQHLSDIGKDVQGLSHRLHSSKLEYLGIVAAANSFCKELSEQQNVEIEFTHTGIPRGIPKEVSLCLFRVLQEALQNAVKHSRVRRFKVDLQGTSEEIHLSVTDFGIGFDPVVAISSRGLGLISMQERVRLIHGDLSIDSQTERGTTIRVRASLKSGESFQKAAG